MYDVRKSAFTLLKRVFREDAYSALVLSSEIKKKELSVLDASFLTALFYGVLERKLFLDHIINEYSKIPVRKIDSDTRIILEMGIYQLMFMDKVPDNSAVDESVKLAKKSGLYRSSGFINALLRSFIRNDKKYTETDSLSIKYSVSEDIADMLIKEYTRDTAERILSNMFGRPPVYIRINTVKTDRNSLFRKFDREGVEYELSEIFEHTCKIKYRGSVEDLDSFKKGMFYIQDISSQICGEILGAGEGETVSDLCSAPGGKSFYSAISMNNKGRVFSYDNHENKLPLISQGKDRLGLDIITPALRDAADESAEIPASDRILCDVPCSGTGILRRKPEIRYKKVTNIDIFPKLQYDILCISGKKGSTNSVFVYSTCSLNPKENREIVTKFLKEHKNFEPVDIVLPKGITRAVDEPGHMLTVLPFMCDSDGFFIAKFRKVSDE